MGEGTSGEPHEPGYFRGVARVPVGAPPAYDAGDGTGELPTPTATGVASRPAARVSRYRWRTLRRGGRLTAVAAGFVLISWGVWAVSAPEGDLVGQVFTLGLVLATAALVFSVSRLLGRVVLESTFGRQRRSALVAHLLTSLLLVTGGIAFLQRTRWVVDVWQWMGERLTG